ncbi:MULTISPECIES: DUF5058 family protein [unclassified Kocuria]|uniref:DUF5058 family protein n=1 Tax=unclassified Kocuria TaxID=2649579 RepID=UPI0006496E7E|nr:MULTISPECIES: DUF5058 family protein [unclassified Kocuria]KLU09644.1 membrane protein [Kocuria sp. SM24M-10]OLT10243.1 DUF5058 domain-containing protein [Kocuria sp. CNJ-770]
MRPLSEYVNLPFLWVCALGVFAVIILQTVIYVRAARTAGPDLGFTKEDLRRSFKSGGIAAIGPSLAVVVVAIALLPLFGAPAVLVRIGLVGSAATETSSANLAAGTMDAELGGAGWTPEVFAVAFLAMSLSGGLWMLATLVLTPMLKRGDTKLRSVNPALMAIVPSAALLAAFASLGVAELPKGSVHVITVATSALVMAVCLVLTKRLNAPWLREWGLGISIIVGLVVAYFAHGAGLGPAA